MNNTLVPMTVIGGFLGAGKTTLVNRLLQDNTAIRFAVLVNDFGDLAIDDELITSHDGETIALANGCICCTIGDDLVATIMDLMDREVPPQHLVVEASGVSDPRLIAELGSLCPGLIRDLTIVVVDVAEIMNQWSDERLRETVDRQISSANLIVMSKIDTQDDESTLLVESWLHQQAPDIAIIRSSDGAIPFNFFTDLSVDKALISTDSHQTNSNDSSINHRHSDIFRTITLTVPPALSMEKFREKVSLLPRSVLRAKGFVRLAGDDYLLQKVGRNYTLSRQSTDQFIGLPNAIKNAIVLICVTGMPLGNWFDE